MDARRWLAPWAAALAVLVVLTGTWTLVGPGDGTRPRQPPTPLPSPQAGSLMGGPPRTPVPSRSPPLTDPQGVAIDRYALLDPRHLRLLYTIGADCYGVLRPPRVRESSRVVIVTLTHEPLRNTSGKPCPSTARAGSVRVALRAPLGLRTVLDGSTGGTPVPREAAPGG